MNEILIDTLIDKVDAHEKKIEGHDIKINGVVEKVEGLMEFTEMLTAILNTVETTKADIHRLSFPENELRNFAASLVTHTALLKQPVKKEIIHHHHFSKIIWIAVGLFLVVCLVSTGWYITSDKLDLYKANDTKYRYLKLENNKSLLTILQKTDSLYQADNQLRQRVIAKEEENQRNLEMLQRALRMEAEAKELKQKVSKTESK